MKDNAYFGHNMIELFLTSAHSFPETIKSAHSGDGASSCQQSHANVQEMDTAGFLRAFTDEMPGGFFIYRADGDEEIVYINKAMLRMLHCESEEDFFELTGGSFRGLVHPDDLEHVEQSIKEQIENSIYDLDYVEYRVILKDGEIRWIDDYGHFVHSETAGDFFYVFAGDATEKKERQKLEREELKNTNLQMERQFQNAIQEYHEKINDMHKEQLRRLEVIEGLSVDYESIFYVDLDMNQVRAYRVSSRIEKQFSGDRPVREFVGFDADYIRTWVCPADRGIVTAATNPENIRAKLSTDKSFHVNYRVLKDGKLEYMHLRIVNVGKEGPVSQIVLGYRNVDDEIIQEMQQKQILENALHEANRANNAKNLFLSNMSHDIRTPMNAIVSLTALVKKHINDRERIAEYLEMIAASSDQLLQLLNDVLEISRIESGKVLVEEKECDLLEIVHQVQLSMIPKAAAKNITLSLDISNLKHRFVCADSGKIGKILMYIIDNAVKYTMSGGRITITVAEQEGMQDGLATYEFTVEDNGIGISEAFLKHIFDPFEREKNTTSSGIHGTGLGLTITKKLVWMLGGKIDVFSVIGEGSRFTAEIPVHIQDIQADYAEENEDDVFWDTARSKRVLIVDDNEINLEIEYEVLKDAGFLVDTAVNGSIAVEKVKKSAPGDYDLILMDIQMPVMNGYNATRAIRQIEDPALAGIPIIAVSANTFEEDKRMAIESGMNAHMGKPLDTPRLYKLIRKLLKDRDR